MNDCQRGIDSKVQSIDQVASRAFDFMFRRSSDTDNREKPRRPNVPTGFHNIDKLIRGLYPGELAIITGAPGAGKSAFALNLAARAAIFGASTLLFSLEADSTMTFIRMCASDARVGIAIILSGALSENDWASIADASSRLGKTRIRIYDDIRLTSKNIESEIKALVNEADAGLVVFDGIEVANDLISGYASPMPLRERAVELKRLARCGHIPIAATMDYNPGSSRKINDYDGVFKELPSSVGGFPTR